MIKEQLFDTLLEPAFLVDENQIILYCNETAATICENSVRKILRQKLRITDILQFAEPVEALEQLEKVTDPSPYKEIKFKSPSGVDGKVQITVQPFQSDLAAKCWIVFVRDVTLEERLQNKYRAELEQKEDFILQLEQANKKLEDYSKNLEQMVEERTAEIKSLNHLMRALLDSLDQGFFIFNPEGQCLEVYSQACLKTLEKIPSKQLVWDVLGLSAKQIEGFKKWMMTTFEEMLPFEDLAPLGPEFYPHSEGRRIQLNYYPLRNSATQKIEGIVVVSSDITDLVQAQREAEVEKSTATMIVNLIQKKNEILRFVQESEQIFVSTEKVLSQKSPMRQHEHELLFRNLHTLKGAAATYSLLAMTESSHQSESLLAQGLDVFQAHKSEFLKGFSEVKKHFTEFKKKAQEILGDRAFQKEKWLEIKEEDFSKALLALESVGRAQYLSQGLKEKYLLSSLNEYLEPYQYLSQQTAQALGKKVQPLIFEGLQTPLYCQPLQSLCATLAHAFKNSIDHGIETPEERLAAGKPEAGTIQVSLSSENTNWILAIRDDGRGIDATAIRKKLSGKGYDCSQKTDQEVIQHVFDSQFSTKESVTEISGRGVGMDAIKFAAQDLGGHVIVESKVGFGTVLKIFIPKEKTYLNLRSQAA